MKFRFRYLPGETVAVPRPTVDVHVEGIDSTALACLIDTGSLHNRFGLWVARAAGIDLSERPNESIGVGGRPLLAKEITVRLGVGDMSWEAPVWFCDPWPWGFQILGQDGFFRWFRISIQAAERTFSLTPA